MDKWSVNENETCVAMWKIIAHFGGYGHQKEKAIEELGELSRALARDLQGEGDRANIAEEMADVYIMLAQLELIYGNHRDVVRVTQEKIDRTMARIEAERRGVRDEPERHEGAV